MALGTAIFIYGLAFGLVAAQAGLSWGWALAMSISVFSGSAQLAAMSLIQAGEATLLTLFATVLVMNARYLLFGATIQPWLSQAGPLRGYGSLLMLGDANWIATMRAAEKGEQDRAYLAGTGRAADWRLAGGHAGGRAVRRGAAGSARAGGGSDAARLCRRDDGGDGQDPGASGAGGAWGRRRRWP